MATGNMTTTTAALHIDEVWPGDVIRAMEFDLVIAPRVYREWKFAGHGDVYHIPRIPNIEAETKSASTSVTFRTYTDTEQQITINVHQASAYKVEDITTLLSKTPIANEMKRKIGYALGRAVDVNLATLPQNFSQIIGTLGSELNYDNMVAAWALLAAAGYSLNDNCTWFLSPGAVAGFLKQEIVINQLYAGDRRAVQTANVGNMLGAPIIQTNLTRAPSAGQSESFLVYKQAMALIMAQEVKMVSEYIAQDLADVIVGHQVYGYTEVDRYSEAAGNITATDEWAVLLRTVA